MPRLAFFSLGMIALVFLLASPTQSATTYHLKGGVYCAVSDEGDATANCYVCGPPGGPNDMVGTALDPAGSGVGVGIPTRPLDGAPYNHVGASVKYGECTY